MCVCVHCAVYLQAGGHPRCTANMAAPCRLQLPRELHREYLCCGLCGQEYRDPRLLPCSHTFCRDCLHHHVLTTTTTLPHTGIRAFPTNNLAQLLVDKLRAQPPPGGRRGARESYREMEDSGVDSVVGSMECLSVASCDLTTPPTDHSSDTATAAADDHSTRGQLPAKCQCHVDPSLYCADCELMLCASCFSTCDSHRQHQVCALSEKAGHHKDNLQSTVHSIQQEVLSLKRGLVDLRTYTANIGHSKAEAVRDIHQRANNIRDLVTSIERRMVSEVEVVVQGEVNRVDMQADHNKSMLTTLEGLACLISQLLKQGSDLEVTELDGVLRSFAKDTLKSINRSEERHLLERPLVIQFTNPNNAVHDNLKQAFGTVLQSRPHICKVPSEDVSNPTETESPCHDLPRKITPEDLCLTTGQLIKTFSLFTESSTSVPNPTSICCQDNGDLIVVDQGNKCVKFYREGAVYKKIYGSESLFGVAQLPDGNIAVHQRRDSPEDHHSEEW